MDAERWQAVQRLFHEALEKSPEERALFLDAACGEDAELRAEVDSLLEAHFADTGFLESSAFDAATSGGAAGERLEPGARIDDYEIVRRLGAGGMGDVFLAHQETAEFSRQVAIKIVKRGMDTDEVLRRFSLERRILATLVHPNIAQFHDAGATDDGRPYFVMEYVDGERLDDWIKEQELPIRARLKLFHAVCQAVQYAHQNLVVHRDIKPGNVLVSTLGTPKLVDFGIGKILLTTDASATAATGTRQAALTPDYAAPEQLLGEPVTTATDIYALGALLYEVLTGERPWGNERMADAERARRITQQPPTRPSVTAARSTALRPAERTRRARELRGELDDIVLQAMRAEPERRYRTAEAFAEDIDRYLRGLAVQARGDSPLYLARKFVRRNAWMVAAATALVGGLVAVTATTVIQSERVARERDKAQEVQRFLLESFGASTADGTPGDVVSVRQLLDGQAAIVDNAYDDPELKAEMLFVLGDAYDRLGLYDDAELLATRSLEERQALFLGNHPDVAASLNLLGWVRHGQGSSDDAAQLLEQSVAMWRALGGTDDSAFARALNDLGVVYDQLERRDEAEQLLRESLDVRTREGAAPGPGVAVTSNNLAVLSYRRGDYAGAQEFGQQALDALRESVGPDHQRTFVAQANLATFKWVAGDLDGAAELLEDLLERQTRIDGGRNARTANSMVTYASLLRVQNRMIEAEGLLRDALAIQEEVLDPSHRSIGNTARLLGIVLLRTERGPEAIPFLERALDVNRRAYGGDHRQIAESLTVLASAYQVEGREGEAERLARESAAMYDRTTGPEHPRAIGASIRHGEILLMLDRVPEATTVLEATFARATTRMAESPELMQTARFWLAEARFAGEDWVATEALVNEIRENLSNEESELFMSRFEDLGQRIAMHGDDGDTKD